MVHDSVTDHCKRIVELSVTTVIYGFVCALTVVILNIIVKNSTIKNHIINGFKFPGLFFFTTIDMFCFRD